MKPWTLVFDARLYGSLQHHLFPGDDDEHGAVIAAGITESSRSLRLLGREFLAAIDGVDFVPGRRGYRMLTPEFVRDKIRYCRDERLVYLAVHNHGGRDHVAFSPADTRSHERGYPALLDISGMPVGALVFAENAVAGDIWTADRARRPISETIVVGRNVDRFYSSLPPPPPSADTTFDRQTRWFGDRGQVVLSQLKVGIIGAGGVGLPLTMMMARLGVGSIVQVDPDHVDPTNLPRIDASRVDAMAPLRRVRVLERFADRLSAKKVRVARRIARRASRSVDFTGLPVSVIEPEAAFALTDCDFLFLAADEHLARMVFNALTHQYLIPGIQLGTRIATDEHTGVVDDIRTNVRLVLPHVGCLRCSGLISAVRLQEEAMGAIERERNRYIDELPAPSVITFNTFAAAQAANDFLLMMGGLMDGSAPLDYLRSQPHRRRLEPIVGNQGDPECPDCGSGRSRRARGDTIDLPLPERPSSTRRKRVRL